MFRARHGREPNVTGRPTAIDPPFITATTGSIILPDHGNYRYYLNAGIMAMTMNGTAQGLGVRPAADRPARGNRR